MYSWYVMRTSRGLMPPPVSQAGTSPCPAAPRRNRPRQAAPRRTEHCRDRPGPTLSVKSINERGRTSPPPLPCRARLRLAPRCRAGTGRAGTRLARPAPRRAAGVSVMREACVVQTILARSQRGPHPLRLGLGRRFQRCLGPSLPKENKNSSPHASGLFCMGSAL